MRKHLLLFSLEPPDGRQGPGIGGNSRLQRLSACGKLRLQRRETRLQLGTLLGMVWAGR